MQLSSEDGATPEPRWFYCLEECEWLAFWIGPHRHLLRDDGTAGIVVERLKQIPPQDEPVIYSLPLDPP